jgi:hypothetical protein
MKISRKNRGFGRDIHQINDTHEKITVTLQWQLSTDQNFLSDRLELPKYSVYAVFHKRFKLPVASNCNLHTTPSPALNTGH